MFRLLFMYRNEEIGSNASDTHSQSTDSEMVRFVENCYLVPFVPDADVKQL